MAERDKKGRFVKGNGTTRKGSPNKAKKDFIELVEKLVFEDWDTLLADMLKLEPKDRIRIKADLIKYILPSKKAVDSNISIDGLTDEQADRILETLMNKHGL